MCNWNSLSQNSFHKGSFCSQTDCGILYFFSEYTTFNILSNILIYFIYLLIYSRLQVQLD